MDRRSSGVIGVAEGVQFERREWAAHRQGVKERGSEGEEGAEGTEGTEGTEGSRQQCTRLAPAPCRQEESLPSLTTWVARVGTARPCRAAHTSCSSRYCLHLLLENQAATVR